MLMILTALLLALEFWSRRRRQARLDARGVEEA
jgi:hypothetical protein